MSNMRLHKKGRPLYEGGLDIDSIPNLRGSSTKGASKLVH